MKYKLLVALSVQRTLYNILIHHAGVANYSYNSLLLLIDTIRFTVCFIMVCIQKKSIQHTTDWKIMLFPAILSFIKQNTIFYGMLLLDPSLHQLVYQINIIFSH